MTSALRPAMLPALVIGIAAMAAAAETLRLDSAWSPESPTVDGKLTEWSSPLVTLGQTKLSLGARNDGQHLYIALASSDQATCMLLAAAGLTVWMDPAGKEKKAFGKHLRPLLDGVNKSDSGNLTREEILEPKGMGAIDLVVMVESPKSVASALQRVGRAGHQADAVSAGRLFPKFRGDLLECAVLAERMREGLIERTQVPRQPLDVLAQQIVAMCAVDDWTVDDLERVVRRAYSFSSLSRDGLENVLGMLAGHYPSEEFAELRPRIIWDRDAGTLSSRRDARTIAVVNAGTIPDRGLYGVFLSGSRSRTSRARFRLSSACVPGSDVPPGRAPRRWSSRSRPRRARSPRWTFGYVGKLYDPEHRCLRKAWVFVMVLGFSRHMFCRIVFDQKIETWLELHVAAFAALGGVVEVVVPDNQKSAVIRAAFGVTGPTTLNRSYRELARHYGFKVDPTPVRDPRKKGKVESGVEYVKNNFFRSRREILDAGELQQQLDRWVEQIAGQRRHGCSRPIPRRCCARCARRAGRRGGSRPRRS